MEFDRNPYSVSSEDIDNTSVIGLLVERDTEIVKEVQKILTSYGCYIRTRLGVNEVFYGKQAGLIILELKGDVKQRHLLVKDLNALKNVYLRVLVF